MIAGIEERSLNAWPAQRYLLHDGWMLGLTGGYTRRANCVNSLSPGKGPIYEKIAWCEDLYESLNLPTIFRITPLSQPDVLDLLLEERDYQREAETEVLYSPIESLRYTVQANYDKDILPREEWLKAYWQVTQQSQDKRVWHQSIVQSIIPAVCGVVVREQGTPVAVGLGVLERGIVGIFDVFTDTQYRRQGCATQILSTILSWAVDNGAQGAYLQVMSDNLPALALYTKLGFGPCYRYWYRVRPYFKESKL